MNPILRLAEDIFSGGAELTLAAVRTSMLASSANVYKAMGGGWVDIAGAMSGSSVSLPPPGILQQNSSSASK